MRFIDWLALPIYLVIYWRPWRNRTDQFHCLCCDKRFNLKRWWRPSGITVDEAQEHLEECSRSKYS